MRAARVPGLEVASKEAAIGQWFLLADRGPLADARVRRAMNHAIHRRLLVELTEHGFGSAMNGVVTRGSEGYIENEPYRYSPELARQLLAEAGYGEGFTLRGLVSETSSALFFVAREFLSRVGIKLEADVVPRAEWMRRVGAGKARGTPYEGDFGVVSIDNPLDHALFHHLVLLFGPGESSLIHDPKLDELFLGALTTPGDGAAALAALERYVRDEARLVFGVQQDVHAAWRQGFSVALPRSGHFDTTAFWSIRAPADATRESAPPVPPPAHGDLAQLAEATGHTGAFYLRPGVELADWWARRVWQNVDDAQRRWRVQNEPMLASLVDLLEARTSLANVMGSTDRVVIVGYSVEGRRLFANRGYALTFGDGVRSVVDDLGADGPQGWSAIRAAVDREGSWLGPVALAPEGRPAGAPSRLFLTVTAARDDDGVHIGYTLVFTDHSGEEERIRNKAIRTILDNVPYGLFVLDASGHMKPGYSDACRGIFTGRGELEGQRFASLVGFGERASGHFEAVLSQVFDDFLPAEVSLAQLPSRVALGERTYSMHGSVVRGDDGQVGGVLFTMLDISNLVAAEREAELHRATVLVLRYRASFEGFLREFYVDLERLVRDAEGDQRGVRSALHTAKGVFAQFSLYELSERIHVIEDLPSIDGGTLAELRAQVRRVVERHRDVWDIDLEATDPKLVVTESLLREVEHEAAQTEDARKLQRLLHRTVATIRQKRAAELLGPIADAAKRLAERRGKQLDVVVRGGEERIPLRHAGAISALVHLARNAVDHGVETPSERGAKGPTATLEFEVARRDGALVVVVRDDGRGIDVERLVAKAVEAGGLSAPEAAALSPRERLELVFATGLSTAESVTDTSGRGVGAGAVKASVERLGGEVHVESVLGQGTTFVLRMPLEGGLGRVWSIPPPVAA